jgi:hypothetical protein
MARKTKTFESAIEMFETFVRDNPKLACSMAFELGSLVGGAVRNSSKTTKYIKKQTKRIPPALANAVPRNIHTALKFLPSPKVQPRKRPHAKRSTVG